MINRITTCFRCLMMISCLIIIPAFAMFETDIFWLVDHYLANPEVEKQTQEKQTIDSSKQQASTSTEHLSTKLVKAPLLQAPSKLTTTTHKTPRDRNNKGSKTNQNRSSSQEPKIHPQVGNQVENRFSRLCQQLKQLGANRCELSWVPGPLAENEGQYCFTCQLPNQPDLYVKFHKDPLILMDNLAADIQQWSQRKSR